MTLCRDIVIIYHIKYTCGEKRKRYQLSRNSDIKYINISTLEWPI